MSTATLPDQLDAVSRDWITAAKGHLIAGEIVPSADGSTFESLDPGTGRAIATVAQGGPADVDRAVAAARAAFDGEWSQVSARDRGLLIGRLADLVEEHADELAQIESLDNGKPATMAKIVDVASTADHLRYFAGWPTKLVGEVVPVRQPDMHCYTRLEPVGVAGQIIPWNFPLLMASWKIAPALAAGCTIVLKPAEQTPLSALRLGELALEAGLPAGVLNVVTGDGDDRCRAGRPRRRRQDRVHRLDSGRPRDRVEGRAPSSSA